MTALHHAADTGRTPMCRYLLLAGAKRSAQDVSGRTPFDLCREAHPRAYEVLRGFAPLLPPPRVSESPLSLGSSTVSLFF